LGITLHKTPTISELVENPTDGFFAWREKVVADEKVVRNRSAGDKEKRQAEDTTQLYARRYARNFDKLQIPDVFIKPCI
jgi:hypothetical protein